MDRPLERWERLLATIRGCDPYGHLTSIHNAERMFDQRAPGITYVSVQHWDTKRTREWRDTHGKPIVNVEPE